MNQQTILYIEDNEIIRENTMCYLEDEEFNVQTAVDGIEGMEKFIELSPDVVLLDLTLPGISGVELLIKIKKEAPDTEVIIISGTGKEEDIVHCINQGAYKYLKKPANLVEIGAEVKSALELTDLRRRNKEYQETLEDLVIERTRQFQDSEEKYRKVFDNANEAIFVAQKDLIGFFNPKTVELFGYSEEEIDQMPFINVVHPDDQHVIADLHSRRIIGEKLAEIYSFRAITKKGDLKWIEIKPVALLWNGSPATLNFCSDITGRKKTEELKKAKEIAEQANITISEWVNYIAHELRTPLNGIVSYSNLGITNIQNMKQEKIIHYFDQISKSSGRLERILTELLDLSKLELGKLLFSMKKANVINIINEAIYEVNATIQEKGLNIIIQKCDIDPILVCDSFRIGQVIRNLVSNSIKFSDQGSDVIFHFSSATIKGKRKTDSSLKAMQISVSDQGAGIPEDELEKIFNKFAQSSITQKGQGTGLGLPICKEIVSAHKGRIWAENNREKGACFSFVLPYEQES